MNSVQENKNELEAAVRYCESAISRAKATIESMEFRQQAATKAWQEQTGREAALEREVGRLRAINAERETILEERKTQLVEWRDRSAGYTKEIGELKVQLGEREDKWDDAMNENRELHRKIQEMEQTMQLQKDQISMFQRKMSRLNEVNR